LYFYSGYFTQAVLHGIGVGAPGSAVSVLDDKAAEPTRRMKARTDERRRVFIFEVLLFFWVGNLWLNGPALLLLP
jgi:hypothetical protein